MRRRVTTADYYRYYRIPTHLAPSRSISSHAILLVLQSVDVSLSVILRAIESWQSAIVDIDFHVKEMLERTSFRWHCHDEYRRNFCHANFRGFARWNRRCYYCKFAHISVEACKIDSLNNNKRLSIISCMTWQYYTRYIKIIVI